MESGLQFRFNFHIFRIEEKAPGKGGDSSLQQVLDKVYLEGHPNINDLCLLD